jgi:hypothetical protein
MPIVLHRISLEEASDLVVAGEVAREQTVPGNVPGDGRVERGEYRRNVALRMIAPFESPMVRLLSVAHSGATIRAETSREIVSSLLAYPPPAKGF